MENHDDDNDDDNDDEHDDEDQKGHNSDNFQARKSRFCMVKDLNNIYLLILTIMMIIMMMMMNMMVKIKMAITRTIFKLGSPDFAW